MKKKTPQYKIIGCDHRYVPETPFKKCSECSLKLTDDECRDTIAVGERYYVYEKVTVRN